MKLLVIDGNSIVNRAFYGIKLLTTKDGKFTNGIYGFLKILIKLREECNPDAVAVAFDLKEPTFRHKMYDAYKAGRKGMPPELASQMPILKELLTLLGYKIVEMPGYEADDILGTLSAACGEGDECFIATGDRDSLQLVRDNVSVLLASTKMGKAQTVKYTPELIAEFIGVPSVASDFFAYYDMITKCVTEKDIDDIIDGKISKELIKNIKECRTSSKHMLITCLKRKLRILSDSKNYERATKAMDNIVDFINTLYGGSGEIELFMSGILSDTESHGQI